MNTNAQFERALEQWLEAEAPASAPTGFHVSVMDRARTLRQRPAWTTTTARQFGRGRGMTLLAAAAAVFFVGGALAVGSGVFRHQAVIPSVTAPSAVALARAKPATSPEPSQLVTAAPSPTAASITWSTASLKQDWPAPVRTEPASAASVAPMPPTYVDPIGDAGRDANSYVDIRDVTANSEFVLFDLTSKPPAVDPSTAWIAYGMVVDDDRDGIPDWRYGVDNLPANVGKDVHRAWRTDLHTGRTEYSTEPLANAWGGRGDPLDQIGKTQFGTGYPAGVGAIPRFRFYNHGDLSGGGTYQAGAKFDKPFYVWASAIVDGRVVATDYAPDTGWLVPSPDGANPGGTYVVPALPNREIPFHLALTVPEGWSPAGPGVRSDASAADLEFLTAEWACDASGHPIKSTIGPGIEDLVTFLGGQPMISVSANTDVMVDGYRGRYLEYTTSYVAENNCGSPDWPFDGYPHHQVWILDVDGVRLVIDASAGTASEAVKTQMRQIVHSIAIGP